MPESLSTEETVIRVAALKAAKDAADHMVKNSVQKHSNSVGAFALYTWGSLAFVSAVFATVIGISPDAIITQPAAIADTTTQDTVVKRDFAKVEADSEALIESTETPATTEAATPARTEAAAATSTTQLPEQTTDTVELIKPDLPEILPPKRQLVKTKKATDLDDRSTGSINRQAEQIAKPFEEALRPEFLFAVDIGGATSASPLVGRYAAMKRRAPDLFEGLEPRIQVKGKNQDLEARLIAGPFTSATQVAQFCRSLRLRLTVDCTISAFQGDIIR
ncbi:MAG: hypothetical protein GKR97_09480 [Rhizobiaceae bacterium]|nr:hypothetical protein [Rhizobiaceae bacterium]